MKPLLMAVPGAPTCAASEDASSAPIRATTAWRQLLTSTPVRNRSPGPVAEANTAAPSAATAARIGVTGASGNAPSSIFINPMVSASGQMAQNMTMKGAARYGIGSQRAIAMLTAATTAAST